MTLQVSTAYKEHVAQLWKLLFDGAVIRVFSGARPVTSDHAETGTLLGVVTLNGLPGAGLVFEVSGPYVSKPVLASWLLTAEAGGEATWFRVAFPGDLGGDSYTDLRVDGSIGPEPASDIELVVPDVIVIGNVYPLDQFLYTIPPIVGV